MSDTQLSFLPEQSPQATKHPRCPRCQTRMAVQRAIPARPGFEYWTLRCIKCDNICEAQVHTDPITPDARGWIDSELAHPFLAEGD
jgi:hypothetical protein